MTDQNTLEKIKHHQKQCTEKREELKGLDIMGPWMDEPDRVEFKSSGLECLLVRHASMFQWCGYVGVPKDHPLYEKHYDSLDIDVHGGLTYADYCQSSICHVTGEEDKLYWFGFDCAHAGDLMPGMQWVRQQFGITEFPELKKLRETYGDLIKEDIYRDMNFVMEQTKYLAKQLAYLK